MDAFQKLITAIGGKVVVEGDRVREISGGYAGDLLSYVMGKAPKDTVWFTIMNNVNVAAVAHLADVSAVVIAAGVVPDDALAVRCGREKIMLLTTSLDVFSAIEAWVKS